MKQIILLGFFLILSNLTFAAERIDGIAAVVGSDVILDSELKDYEANAKASGKSLLKNNTEKLSKPSKSEILEKLIQDRLLKQEMDRQKIEVEDKELQQAIRMVIAQNQMTLEQLKQELQNKGVLWSNYEDQLRQQIRTIKFMRQNIYSKLEVTEADYEQFKQRYPDRAQLSRDAMANEIMEAKGQQGLKDFVKTIRDKTYIEIK